MNKLYGLIGEKIAHSRSPEIHQLFGNDNFGLLPMSKNELEDFFASGNVFKYSGLNVTIPYKRDVMKYCDYISDEAMEIGCVNTLAIKNGSIHAYNTDLYGFMKCCSKANISFINKKIIILGGGATSMTVTAAAKKMGAAEIVIISRSGENNYENLNKHFNADIIVNTTPIGTHPDLDGKLINLSDFNKLEGVVDVIYNPLKTRLLLEASKLGINYTNGLPMLVYQAKKAAELFAGMQISESRADEICNILNKSNANIILIGMPGCGKSTVGKIISEKTKRKFIDTDELIEEKTQKSIPEIFTSYGEPYFRSLEKDAVLEAAKNSGSIIATGGGVVLDQENIRRLKQNGFIVYIKRDIAILDKSDRPVSKAKSLEQLYQERASLYEKAAEFEVENSNTPEAAADLILNNFRK